MKQYFVFLLVFAFLTSACRREADLVSPVPIDPTPDTPASVTTAVGQPIGAMTSATIGPEGGRLVSSDGKLTLTIPAGALSKITTIAVEPVETTIGIGLGISYHLMPAETQLAKPVTLTYQYADQDMNGVDASHLAVAQQQPDRSWAVTHQATLNTTNRTISSKIRNFSWATLVTKYRLFARKREVIPSEEATVRLYYSEQGFDTGPDDDLFVPIPVLTSLKEVRAWTINGQLFGDDQTGAFTLKPNQGTEATFLYSAPAKLPAKEKRTVTLGVELEHEGQAKLKVFYDMSIIPPATLTIDGKNYEDVDVQVSYQEGEQGKSFSVRFVEPTKSAKIADFTVSIWNWFAGSKMYELKGGWEELQKSTFFIGGPAVDGTGSYSTLYFEETADEIGNAVFDPATLTVLEFNGINDVAAGKISCTLFKETKRSESIKVSAKFRGVVKN